MSCRFLSLNILVLAALAGPLADDKQAVEKDRILKLFVEEFVALTPGEGRFPASFLMGDENGPDVEKPPVKVKLSKPFALARYEVTQELYEAVTGANPSRWTGPRNAVERVSWEDASAFCRKVTDELRQRRLIGADEVIRLPTEAEWEYGCRAGTTTRYFFGDDAGQLGEYAWFNGNARGNDPPVGRKKPNAWGLYDLHGYVWEWCADAWRPTLAGTPADGTAGQAGDGRRRVLRGGSWADDADKARSSFRHYQPAGFRSEAVGFRCVRTKA
jgi:formylglycine-generating enzyme required for sulfatase activity